MLQNFSHPVRLRQVMFLIIFKMVTWSFHQHFQSKFEPKQKKRKRKNENSSKAAGKKFGKESIKARSRRGKHKGKTIAYLAIYIRFAAVGTPGMPERRLPISAPAAAGPRRHSRRPRRGCRLIILPAFTLALISLAYLAISSHANLPFHGKQVQTTGFKIYRFPLGLCKLKCSIECWIVEVLQFALYVWVPFHPHNFLHSFKKQSM